MLGARVEVLRDGRQTLPRRVRAETPVNAIAEDGDQTGTLYQVLTPGSVGFGDS